MLAQHYLLLHTLPMAAQTFGASAVILSPILNLLLVAAAILLFLTLIQNNFVRNIFAGIGYMSILNSLFSNDNSRGSRFYTHPSVFYVPPAPYYGQAGGNHRHSGIHTHPSETGRNSFYSSPVHTHPSLGGNNNGPRVHGHP